MSTTKSSEGVGTAFILFVILAFPLYIWNGFVLKTIWNWFVPSTFHNAPHLALAQAIGLGLVVSIFTYRRVATSNKEETALEGFLSGVTSELLVGGMSLLVGLIVHAFM